MTPDNPEKMDSSTALSIYRQEKERALAERRISHSQLMQEAKDAFAKMLADAQLARKGGRPRTNPLPPGAAVKAAAAAVPVVVPAKKPTAEKVAKPKTRAAAPKAAAAKKGPARKAASAKTARAGAHVKTKGKGGGAKPAGARTTKPAARGKATKKR
jgi:hypothetical protein